MATVRTTERTTAGSALMREIARYLEIVELFRREGAESRARCP